MKTILVPLDFSENSENALGYAVALNEKINAEIILYHAFQEPIVALENNVLNVLDHGLKNNVKEKLKSLKRKYQLIYPAINFKSIFEEGDPGTGIVHAEKMKHADLVILGNKNNDFIDKIISEGPTAFLLEESICPVISVPANSKFKGIRKIVFAANYGIDDYKNASDIIDFAKLFNAEVILLHVSENNRAMDYNQLTSFAFQMTQESGYDKIIIKVFEDSNVYNGINTYLEEIRADLFSISMRNRSFFSKIFQPSLTKKMVYHSQIPTMIYHTDYK